MILRSLIKAPLRALGYDIVKVHRTLSSAERRQRLLDSHQVDLVLDVGANTGQYALELRRNRYRGRIVSFEPRAKAFQRLGRAAESDPLWQVLPFALGCENGTARIHVSKNEYSSSLLNLLPAHVQAEPESAYVGTETIEVRTLDSVLPGHVGQAQRVFLKIDTQGFEREVLAGARQSLERIAGLQMEMSLIPLYENETLFPEMLQQVMALGFRLTLVEPGIHDPSTGALLQMDGVFFREPAGGRDNR
jgi:FkbM family methyltransferase